MRPTPKAGILEIAPYVPGRSKAQGVERPLKLSANENPFGCSEAARAAFLAAASDIHLYPDARTSSLRAAIAEKFDLEPERLVFGAGSDEIFSMAAQAYLGEGDNAVQPQYGFAAWAIAVQAAGAAIKSAPEPDFVVDIDGILAAVNERTRIVFIANPANPTGTWLPFSEIERLHAGLPKRVLLVLDGAYAECAFGIDGYSDGLTWSRDKENVLVTRTFSKAYGLASLRVGWAYGPGSVIAALDRIRLPFSVPRAGEAAAVAALGDDAFVAKSVGAFAEGRQQLDAACRALGARTLPSLANFVTARFADASAIDQALASRGILVRHLANYGMPDWLRISVGRPAETERAITVLADICR
ncbi:histidinol-phosphate transaminase [Terricaulis silvestris]|uniref:Histidinol-phosphate aminotransferase n=1 Tax=Terricaulis silvestris TaxID=2686094 RepID=A0A6I6MR71_9CAUL|nr:histidinol-phosphate transaminase [Terricaulis silvestris]QGZ93633.1 Histidinol-phosphate aminotransferase 2 [Terricaulis silvestris]